MHLSIYGLNDFITAHEITDEWQILTIACLIRMCEGAGHNVSEFVDVAHVNDAQCGIKRKRPALGPVRLLVRTKGARQILIVERRDNEGVILKPAILHYPIDFGLAGKVGNVELAAADRFYVGQRGPDKVFDTGILGSAYRRRCLLEFVGTCFSKIGDQKDAMCSFKCSL